MLAKVRTVTVVTPCRNAVKLIEETLRSVLEQTAVRRGRVALEYYIIDGASSDGTPALVAEIVGDRAVVVSEPDRSMYDALAKGFKRATGDVLCYLNAGDLLSPSALDIVADVMEQVDAKWLTGYTVTYNAMGQTVQVALPFRYRQSLMVRGAYGRNLPSIQQESTFWRRDLMSTVDLDYLSSLRLAGDAYLWHCFAGVAEPWVVEAHLGGFRCHGSHLSADLAGYRREARKFHLSEKPSDRLVALLDYLVWKSPPRVKKKLNSRLLRYSHANRRWE